MQTVSIKEIPPQPSSLVSNYWEKLLVKARFLKIILEVSHQQLGSWRKALRVLRETRKKFQSVIGHPLLNKIAKVDGRYYWMIAAPGIPSAAARLNLENEYNRISHFKPSSGLKVLFLAITKKCPLNCEHCFEWDNLNQPEKLTTADLIQIVSKYQDYGTTQIMLSGGEPMVRIKDVFRILEIAKPTTDFWIFTSGFQLTAENARRLKQAGLRGVEISLDHYLPEAHDRFRGYPGAFNWATQGAINARAAGLVTTLSLTATRDFTTAENLKAYLDLAKKLGVTFVQLLEPIPVGRYRGQEVALSEAQIQVLTHFYTTYNNDDRYKDYPIIHYPGYLQRRTGCLAAGNRFMYIDTDGDVHICPFCSGKVCHALSFSVEDTLALLGQIDCHYFSKADDLAMKRESQLVST
ncbi:MAG: radical SAM protein [Saprospiraceae bacterium]|nr:radical SAM protein [Saprospiraceae bacterium]